MSLKGNLYDNLPDHLKPLADYTYERTVYKKTIDKHRSEFVENIFKSIGEYNQYADELENELEESITKQTLEKYQNSIGHNHLLGIRLEIMKDVYAVIRKRKPETIVETGVCNGVSTLCILLALHKNESGELYSIDYPFKSDKPLEKFRAEDYNEATIPSDKEPGWIVPNELQTRWELIIGKSQQKLPELVTNLNSMELFVHDSDHSHPCMMFEYELAYEWLVDGGVIFSDDITWNDAFSIFTNVRDPNYGYLSRDVGYILKDDLSS